MANGNKLATANFDGLMKELQSAHRRLASQSAAFLQTEESYKLAVSEKMVALQASLASKYKRQGDALVATRGVIAELERAVGKLPL